MRLFLDDDREFRPTPPGWERAVGFSDAVSALETGRVTEISFDHDLGLSGDLRSGYDVVNWMERNDVWPRRATIHSANIVGSRNIIRALVANGYRQVYSENGSCFLKPTFDRS